MFLTSNIINPQKTFLDQKIQGRWLQISVNHFVSRQKKKISWLKSLMVRSCIISLNYNHNQIPNVFSLYSYFVHEWDDLQDELILPQVIAMFEDDWVHGSILSLEDQLGWHQGTLTHTQDVTWMMMCHTDTGFSQDSADWINRKSTETRAEHQWLEQILQSQGKCQSHSWWLKMLCTLKSVAVSGTMPLILIWGSRGRGMGSISERFTFSLSASRACSRSVCRHRGRDTVNTTFPQWKHKTTCIACFNSKIQKQTLHN